MSEGSSAFLPSNSVSSCHEDTQKPDGKFYIILNWTKKLNKKNAFFCCFFFFPLPFFLCFLSSLPKICSLILYIKNTSDNLQYYFYSITSAIHVKSSQFYLSIHIFRTQPLTERMCLIFAILHRWKKKFNMGIKRQILIKNNPQVSHCGAGGQSKNV